jgi:hypothetical protein
LQHKRREVVRLMAIVWNVLGMSDIFVSAALASSNMTSVFRPVSPPPKVDIVTHFPLVLLPVYGMAIVVFIHLNSLWHLLSPRSVHKYRASGRAVVAGEAVRVE